MKNYNQHNFQMMKGATSFERNYSDTICCTKCGYISYQAGDGKSRAEDRQNNLPKECIN